MNANELLEQCEKDGIRLCLQSGQLQITGNLKKIDELAPIIRQHKTDIIRMLEQKDKRAMEATRYMQAEIALFHGEAIAFIARYLQKRYGKTYWQAQDEATTVWNILRKTRSGRHWQKAEMMRQNACYGNAGRNSACRIIWRPHGQTGRNRLAFIEQEKP